jgi:hypothetical protein
MPRINFTKSMSLMRDSSNPTAILLGNGINLKYERGLSWGHLLDKIFNKFGSGNLPNSNFDWKYIHKNHMSNTEFFDIINANYYNHEVPNEINKFIQYEISTWEHNADPKYNDFIGSLRIASIPIVTTNYDDFLIKNQDFGNRYKSFYYDGNKARKYIPSSVKRGSDFYPIYHYYAPEEIDVEFGIEKQFAIWHMHGMNYYHRSLRIGQNDYASLMAKIKRKIDPEKVLQIGKLRSLNDTWIKLFFSSNIIILGLGLEYSDYAIRWLLNKRYVFNKIHDRKLLTHYYYQKGMSNGRAFFYDNIGIDHVRTEYKTMYETLPTRLKKIRNE